MASQAVMILEESRVSPPKGTIPPTSHPLSPFDIPWLYEPPVQRLFFYSYPHPTTSFMQSHLPNLKSTLSLTLQQFYTLAGNARRSPDSDDAIEIYYTEGDGVTFTVAEYDEDFIHLSSGQPRDFSRIHPLIPQLPAFGDTIPLLAIQVTLFPDNGVCIGVTLNHTAGDGSSSVRFFKAWASACRFGGVVPPPLYDPNMMAKALGTTLESIPKGPPRAWPKPSPAPPLKPNTVFASFTLAQDQIQRLKKRAAASIAEPFHCSAFVVSCAYAWVCHVRAKGYTCERDGHFLFMVDCRGRFDPPIPASYFGNCLRPCFTSVNAGELIGEGGFVAASIAIGKAIEGMNGGVLKGAEEWGERVKVMVEEKMLTVAGSPKFRVYDTDFGWGRPERVEIPSIMRTGAISLAEAREEGGGIEIGLALEKHEMNEFETQFNNGLK